MQESQIEEAARLRRAVNRLARRFNVTATDEGLTPTQASVLGVVAGNGPIGTSDLLARELINPTMLSRVLSALDDKGLVRREQHPDDQRAALFEATAEGHAVHQRVKAQRAALVIEGLEQLDDDDREALRRAMGALDRLAGHFR